MNRGKATLRYEAMKKILAVCLSLFASPLSAHPHIFVNTGLAFLVDDQNRLTHVQVTWEYDELFSLLITEDMGLDGDYDGVLTPAELETLTGFDANWIQGYNGDLVGEIDGVPLALSRPLSPTAAFSDGKITSTHLREVAGTPKVSGLVMFKPFDPTYYTAYDVGLPVFVKGNDDCNTEMVVPDIEGAMAMLQAEISAMPEDYDMEAAGLGDIGETFARRIEVICAAG